MLESPSQQNFNSGRPKQEEKAGFPEAAYIHIPFCQRRCYYCDFPVSVVGDSAKYGNSAAIDQYVEVLCKEIELTPVLKRGLDTVFFGGGTPSLLSLKQLEKILKTLDNRFGIASRAEISLEMDPGTFNREKLAGYKNAGMNRICLGVQAFEDELLLVCGRSHSLKDIFVAIELIRQIDIDNFSLDLISGLPDQTIEQWQYSLETAIVVSPEHISCYDLVLEPVTAFGKRYRSGQQPLPTDEITARMYRLAREILTNSGYQHYEISNYARAGYQCRHNRVYWENRQYYGFGMGATSYVQKQRFSRPRTRREYYAWVEQLTEAGKEMDLPKDTDTDVLLETLMLGLRLAEGVSLSEIGSRFGKEIPDKILTCVQPYFRSGWVETFEENEGDKRFKLTDPEGFLFSNTVIAALFDRLTI